jgi:hypothetical protein
MFDRAPANGGNHAVGIGHGDKVPAIVDVSRCLGGDAPEVGRGLRDELNLSNREEFGPFMKSNFLL